MANGKKSFIAYADWQETFETLPDEKAGQLIKHIFKYVNDEHPESDDLLIKVVFANIKMQLKRDLKKWEQEKSEKRIAGIAGNLKRWHPDLYKKYKKGTKELSELQIIAEHRRTSQTDKVRSHRIANIAVNDNVNVNVNVNDINKYIYNKFYDNQIKISENNNNYIKFVKYLFETNPNYKPLNKVLKLSDQITFKRFEELIKLYKPDNIKDKILGIENSSNKHISFNLTLTKWLKNY